MKWNDISKLGIWKTEKIKSFFYGIFIPLFWTTSSYFVTYQFLWLKVTLDIIKALYNVILVDHSLSTNQQLSNPIKITSIFKWTNDNKR